MQVTGGICHSVQVASGAEPRLVRAAHEFEAQMMKELIRPMTKRDDEDDTGSGGALAEFAGEAFGKALSQAGGFGISAKIMEMFSHGDTSGSSGSESKLH